MAAAGSSRRGLKRVSQPRKCKLIIEKDVQIPLRDGTILYADVFRPNFRERVPVILNTGPYQKDKLWRPPAARQNRVQHVTRAARCLRCIKVPRLAQC